MYLKSYILRWLFESLPENSVIRTSQIVLWPPPAPKAQAQGGVLGPVLPRSWGSQAAVAGVDCGGPNWGGVVWEFKPEGGGGGSCKVSS